MFWIIKVKPAGSLNVSLSHELLWWSILKLNDDLEKFKRHSTLAACPVAEYPTEAVWAGSLTVMGKEGLCAGAGGAWLRGIHSQEAESEGCLLSPLSRLCS